MKTEKVNTSFLKKFTRFFSRAILYILVLALVFSVYYWYNNRLFLWEAKLLWPHEPFSAVKFKTGSTQDRAKMSVDLIQSKKLINVEYEKIHEALGEKTGDYYISDTNFTYRLTDKGDADWVLTLITGNDGKIERAFIRKSCCSVSKRIIYFGFDVSESIIRKFNP